LQERVDVVVVMMMVVAVVVRMTVSSVMIMVMFAVGAVDVRRGFTFVAMFFAGFFAVFLTMFVVRFVLVSLFAFDNFDFFELMRMDVKEPHQEEHRQKADEDKEHRLVERAEFGVGMRDQMQHADAEHEAGDEAHEKLHAGVRERDQPGQNGAEDGDRHHEHRVKAQQGEGH